MLYDIIVLSKERLGRALKAAPAFWGVDPESKHNAIFVISPATGADIAEEAGAVKPEVEKAAVCGPVIFWSAPLKTFSRTRYSKIVGSAAYDSVTIRNANTAKKLLELMEYEGAE